MYTSGHLHANDYTMAEWNAYMDYRKKFPIDEPYDRGEGERRADDALAEKRGVRGGGVRTAQRGEERDDDELEG